MNDSPRIYVACLASYNAGILHGEWIDATDADDMAEKIAAMLASSPAEGAEEYAIHDYDGFGELARELGEYPSLESVAEHARMLAEHGDAWSAYVSHVGSHYATPDGFEEAYRGHYADGLSDYAYDLVESCGYLEGVPEFVAQYFDYAAFARDLRLGGDYWEADGHVFTSY